MMTGLEKILDQIAGEAQREADERLAAAKAQASQILEEAQGQADAAAKAILADGERRAQEIRDRAASSADLIRRNETLAFKQQVIQEAIAQAKASLENAPDDDYFDLLAQLAGRSARAGKAEMRLSQRDLDRLPAGFPAKLRAAAPQAEITISPEPADIESGFLLVYDGIDITCSFQAIFEDAEADMRDALSPLLFPGKERPE